MIKKFYALTIFALTIIFLNGNAMRTRIPHSEATDPERPELMAHISELLVEKTDIEDIEITARNPVGNHESNRALSEKSGYALYGYGGQTLQPPSTPWGHIENTDITFTIDNPNGRGNTEIYRSTSSEGPFNLIDVVPHNHGDYKDENLRSWTRYYYKLRAVDGNEYSDFHTLVVSTYADYFKPTVTAKALNESTIEITFTDNTTYETNYYIRGYAETGSSENDFEQEVVMPSDSGATVKITHHPANPGTTYAYDVMINPRQPDEGIFEETRVATATTPTTMSCASSGSIERERWDNVSGYGVSTIPVNTVPTSIIELTSFSTPANSGDNYGARVRGYVCPPQTGSYVFYISSDDNSELWLSTDANPANKRKIASSNWTNLNQWDKYPSQQSAPITLTAGTNYYIEALHKEAGGLDHLAVGWKLPNGTLERPIPGNRLVKFYRENYAPTVKITRPTEGQTFEGPSEIEIDADVKDLDGRIETVIFYKDESPLCQVYGPPYSCTWRTPTPGNYRIRVSAFDDSGAQSTAFVNITVTARSGGNIFREYWYNVAGGDPSLVDFKSAPDDYASYTNFETQQNYRDNYGSRMRAYIVPPSTGAYTFWIASDDRSQLFLSTDENPANAKFIARVDGWTYFRQFTKYSSQRSVTINLKAGLRYYIEALHKEGSGNDHIAVQWQLPDGTIESPIPGSRLIAIEPSTGPNQPPAITITSPQDNQNFSAPASIRIAANVTDADGIQQVVFDVQQGSEVTQLATFTAPPYEFTWNNVPEGSYHIVVSAMDNRGLGNSADVFVNVGAEPCTGAGKIYREIWTGISGTSVSSIPVNSEPNQVVELTSFNTPNYQGNDYGSRIRGYICVPASGAYTFWLSSDDNSELWLSENQEPLYKRKIASVTGATQPLQWDKYTTQKSATINLMAGQQYYVEVLHKEGGGADHVAVGWQMPGGAMERPIPGSRLIPFEESSSSFASARLASTEEEELNIVSLFPNPTRSSNPVTLALNPESQLDFTNASVQVISTSGRVIFADRMPCEDGCQDLSIPMESVPPGIYIVKINARSKEYTRRLYVK